MITDEMVDIVDKMLLDRPFGTQRKHNIRAALEAAEAARPKPEPVAVRVKPLEWHTYKSSMGYKVCAYDPFGMEFGRIDAGPGLSEKQVEELKKVKQADYEARIRSALVAQPVAVGVPEGWKLVPKEPTEEMHDAARDWSVKKYGQGVGRDGSEGCYRAMLAASPEPPVTQPAEPVQAEPIAVIALQRLMAKLADLLDEDKFHDCEDIVLSAGISPPVQAAQEPVATKKPYLTRLAIRSGVTSTGVPYSYTKPDDDGDYVTYTDALTALASPQPDALRKFKIGDRVRKKSGSSWNGRVVGFYSTKLTPIGYAVESEREPGSVQIYPEAALESAALNGDAS